MTCNLCHHAPCVCGNTVNPWPWPPTWTAPNAPTLLPYTFTTYPHPPPRQQTLSDEDIERIATRVAEKLWPKRARKR